MGVLTLYDASNYTAAASSAVSNASYAAASTALNALGGLLFFVIAPLLSGCAPTGRTPVIVEVVRRPVW